MNINELTTEEKQTILENRLKSLSADFERSGYKLECFQTSNANYRVEDCDAILTILDIENNQGISISINDEDAEKLYEFLKERYTYKKELKRIESEKDKPKNGGKRGQF